MISYVSLWKCFGGGGAVEYGVADSCSDGWPITCWSIHGCSSVPPGFFLRDFILLFSFFWCSIRGMPSGPAIRVLTSGPVACCCDIQLFLRLVLSQSFRLWFKIWDSWQCSGFFRQASEKKKLKQLSLKLSKCKFKSTSFLPTLAQDFGNLMTFKIFLKNTNKQSKTSILFGCKNLWS